MTSTDIWPTCKQSCLTCLLNHNCHHSVLLGYCWCFSVEKDDNLLHLMCEFDFLMQPWICDRSTRLSVCLQKSVLGIRWKVRCGEREDGHIVQTSVGGECFMAAMPPSVTHPTSCWVICTCKAHTWLLYEASICDFSSVKLRIECKFYWSTFQELVKTKQLLFFNISHSDCLTCSHKIRWKQSSYSFIILLMV